MATQTKWFIGLSKDEQRDFARLLPTYSDDRIIRQLIKVIKSNIEELKTYNKQDYNVPNWDYLQAHKNGQLESLLLIDQLLKDIRNDN